MRVLLVFITFFLSVNSVIAGETPKKLRKALQQLLPGVELNEIKPAVIQGLFEINIGTEIFYATADGRHLIRGEIIDMKTRENLTKVKRGKLRLALINDVDEKKMIIFSPKKVRRTITVFTDVDCSFCRKFHLDVPELVKNGLRIRYLLFPRNGLDSETYKKSVAVWCAQDRRKAMGIAKAGKKLAFKTCKNPVAEHYRLANLVGVQGTPTIVFENGYMISGYASPAKLLAYLGLKK